MFRENQLLWDIQPLGTNFGIELRMPTLIREIELLRKTEMFMNIKLL